MKLFFCALSLIFSAVVYAAPAAPTNLVAVTPRLGSMTLSWQDNATDETAFEIKYRAGTIGTFLTYSNGIPANTQTWNLSGGAANQLYQFQIRALNASNPAAVEYSEFSNIATVITPYDFVAEQGVAFSQKITTNPEPAATLFTLDTPLPSGLTLDAQTGVISGNPTSVGSYKSKLSIQYADGTVKIHNLTMVIWANVPNHTPPVLKTPLSAKNVALAAGVKSLPLSAFFKDSDIGSAVRLESNLGTFHFGLYPEVTPITVTNFLRYVKDGAYNNMFMHRSIDNFVIQGGGFKADSSASPINVYPSILNEPGYHNTRGTISMAKTAVSPNTATSQFFVSLGDNRDNLDKQNGGFTVFGRVTGTGMTVVDAIGALGKANFTADTALNVASRGALSDVPVTKTPVPTIYNPADTVKFSKVEEVSPLTFTVSQTQPSVANLSIDAAGSLLIEPLSLGQTSVTVTATDLDGLTTQATFPLTIANSVSYEQFADIELAGSTKAARMEDADQDGVPNVMEYMLNRSLNSNDGSPTEVMETSEFGVEYLALAFDFNPNSSGVAFRVEGSNDLQNWSSVWNLTQGLTHEQVIGNTVVGSGRRLIIRDNVPMSGSSKRFLRLRAE